MFTDAERAFIGSAETPGRIAFGRVATATPDGQPHVVPMKAIMSPDGEHVLLMGFELAATYKYRQVQKNPWVAIVWDTIDAGPPAGIKGVEVRGTAVIRKDEGARDPYFEVTPTKVFSWGVNEAAADSFETKMGMNVEHLRRLARA